VDLPVSCAREQALTVPCGTGLQGDGTVSYEDPFSAASAVEWFNGKDFKGVRAALPPVPLPVGCRARGKQVPVIPPAGACARNATLQSAV